MDMGGDGSIFFGAITGTAKYAALHLKRHGDRLEPAFFLRIPRAESRRDACTAQSCVDLTVSGGLELAHRKSRATA
jgi:hypothetical protein